MEVTEQLYAVDRDEWRSWLEHNHSIKKEIWLIQYKKNAGKPCVSYDEAVEEALCFGWIDGTVRSLDDAKWVIRWTPRRKRSIWSQLNKSRAEKMISHGLMTKAGMAKIDEARNNGEWDKATVREDPANVPTDLENALKVSNIARKNFENLAPSYRKQYIWWITEARRKDTRARRIDETIKRLEQNKKPGID